MEIRELIAALSRPDAYSFAVEKVDVRQTHLSVVFLAGELAYKIKKPVRLSFADFGTLKQRRFFCQREVDLNRRLAPDVYLGVVPVTRTGRGVMFDGSGNIVEWAVKMRRLPESATLAQLVRVDKADAALMRKLAERIATFHRTADFNEQISRFARFAAIAANVEDNLAAAANSVGTTISAQVCSRLTDLTRAELERQRLLVDLRADRNVPRDTHGDLRLEHVYHRPNMPPPGDWLIVDCIEFNDRLRYADPVADLAFLVMDLHFSARHDLARSLIEAYFAAADDSDGRCLLPFYTSYRAAVRAKVEGIETGEREVPTDERATAMVHARGHFLLALTELEQPDRKPCLVLVGGLPGTGKSTVAQHVASAGGFRIVRSDEVRKHLAGVGPHESLRHEFGQGIYTNPWTDFTYAECLRRAEHLLFEGERVVIDATFSTERHRRQFLDAAQRWGVAGLCLLCECDAEIAHERLSHRIGDVSDANWPVYREMSARWEAPLPATARAVRTVETGGSVEAVTSHALAVLSAEGLQ